MNFKNSNSGRHVYEPVYSVIWLFDYLIGQISFDIWLNFFARPCSFDWPNYSSIGGSQLQKWTFCHWTDRMHAALEKVPFVINLNYMISGRITRRRDRSWIGMLTCAYKDICGEFFTAKPHRRTEYQKPCYTNQDWAGLVTTDTGWWPIGAHTYRMVRVRRLGTAMLVCVMFHWRIRWNFHMAGSRATDV